MSEQLAAADASLARARDRSAALEDLRRTSFAAFDAGHAKDGEAAWDAVKIASTALADDYDQAQLALERTLVIDGERGDLRRRLAETLYAAALAADRDHRTARRDDLLRRVRLYDADNAIAARWTAPADLTVAATSPGTSITVGRYADEGGHRVLSSPLAHGDGALTAALPPGSYLITLASTDRPTVRYPVVLGPGEHLRLAIGVPEAFPDGFVYIAPGRFLARRVGSRREGAAVHQSRVGARSARLRRSHLPARRSAGSRRRQRRC